MKFNLAQNKLSLLPIVIGVLLLCIALTLPAVADAQQNTGGNSIQQNTGGSLSLQNPLASDDIFELLSQLLDVLMVFAVPLIVFMIIYAGFLYVTARGNPGQISNAHKALTYAVVGGVLILGAWVILEVIQGTVDAFR